jgi:hypothetical protein
MLARPMFWPRLRRIHAQQISRTPNTMARREYQATFERHHRSAVVHSEWLFVLLLTGYVKAWFLKPGQ